MAKNTYSELKRVQFCDIVLLWMHNYHELTVLLARSPSALHHCGHRRQPIVANHKVARGYVDALFGDAVCVLECAKEEARD